MTTKLDKLVVQLDADNAQLRKKLGDSNKNLDLFAKKGARSMDVFKKAAVAALGVFGAVKIAGAVKGTIDFADSIDKAAKAAGVSAQFLQEMRFAADQSGVSMIGLDDSVRRLGRRLGEFINSGGKGPAEKAFKQLGLSAKILSGELSGTEPVFNAVIREMEGLTDVTRKSALAAKLFGDDFGPKLVTLLDQGVDGIQRLTKAARDAGAILTDEMVQSAVDAKDAMGALGFASGRLTDQFIIKLAPALKDSAKWMTEFLSSMGDAPRAIADIEADLARLENRLNKTTNSRRGRRGPAPGQEEELRAELLRAMTGSSDPKELERAADIINKQIKKLTEERGGIPKSGKRRFGRSANVANREERINQQLQALVEQRKNIFTKLKDLNKPDPGKGTGAADAAATAKSEAEFFREVEAAARQAKKEATELQRIMDRLYPNDVKARKFNEELKKLKAANLPAAKLAESIKRLKKELAGAGDGLKKLGGDGEDTLKGLKSAIDGWGRDFADTLLESENNFKGFADSIVRELGRIVIAEATQPTFDAFGDFIGGSVKKIFGFADGGITPGGPVIVGERGPEIVSPPAGSRVTPNSALGGSVTIIQNLDFTNANPATVQLLRQESRNIRDNTIAAFRDMKLRGGLPEFA